ncbi:hypothetical protein ALQ93_01578 [Pseudomonas syringae pv. pisi]|uniref:Apea-like HEPN domain-containing protein n=4 Tax=Pseudomonas syringae group TaxID=136849 RepID=A0A2V4Q147_PSESJ|nr:MULTISPECIES: hypothetical protein [Pseudomonas syringae group]PYD10404.1 hypothetical protein DND62_19315 [Pseudomonas syringae pv. pisi]PYD28230.1 hypothetical protein DND67_20740 [Pseudomonas syringae pv. pisi]PYD29759.1 hypothetical protein DND58_20170 [Pseudomonas syringae pv. pisi]RML58191.1 hypothetical protein ALQ93_01578 [Pseudomonas syringae pv. pisi]RML66826.1 hypothetical protein ALQ92_02794 [Pseudomonas syringae pv. pisi]
MARNFIEYARYVLDTIAEGADVATFAAARLRPPPPDQAKALTEEFLRLEISSAEYVAPTARFYEITFNQQKFLGLVNIPIGEDALTELESVGIYSVDASEALLLASAKEMNLQKSTALTLDELEEVILSQQDDAEFYKGHDIFEILEHFEKITYYNVAANSAFHGRELSEVAYRIATYSQTLVNPKLRSFIDQYRALLSYPGAFMKRNIFWSLTSTHYKHAFLELYRCIESVYTLPRALALKRKAGLTIAGHQVAKMCVEELNWRRKEEDSLKQIFLLIPASEYQRLPLSSFDHDKSEGWAFTVADDFKKNATSLAIHIYKLRNQMVHQFDSVKEVAIRPADWPILIELLINVINLVFTRYADELPDTTTGITGEEALPSA